jgi:hypothetical protein
MSAKVIEVIIQPNGEMKIATMGFPGQTCQDASRFLEEALGYKTNDQPTSEMWGQTQSQRQRVNQ